MPGLGPRYRGPVSDATDAVLAANARFYDAFEARDADAMDESWSTHPDVSCVHPGWPPIRGRDQVMASWRSIFDNDEGPTPSCEAPTVALHGESSATVLCRERLGNVVLIATNVFVGGPDGWRLTHHHASALARVPPTPELDDDLLPN